MRTSSKRDTAASSSERLDHFRPAKCGRADRRRRARRASRNRTATRRDCAAHAIAAAPRSSTSAAIVGRDGQHAKGLPAELLLVLLGGMGGEIGAHLFFEAGLPEGIRPHDRHGAAVDLDHEIATRAIGKLQTEREIRHEADVVHDAAMRERDPQRKWIARGDALIREASRPSRRDG